MEWRSRRNDNGQQKECRFFSQPGGCRFGKACKFAHHMTSGQSQPTANVNRPDKVVTDKQSAGQGAQGGSGNLFIQWRSDVPLNILHTRPLGNRLSSFLRNALRLVGDDSGIMQEVVTRLTSEGGFLRLKELLDQNFEAMPELANVQVMSDQLIPFFKIITHGNVAASIMLEERVGSIYNFLYGRQGERAMPVFSLVARVLTLPDHPEWLNIDSLEPILVAFSNMIDMNVHALANESLPPLAELLFDICNNADDAVKNYLRKYVTKIGRRLKVGGALRNVKHLDQSSKPRATFVLPQDPPGALSPNGPRHDNDHVDIQHITILPTSAEIKATRQPYLPSLEVSSLHLPGLRGLLDRHFRLLREDTVGQLRDAIRAELAQGSLRGKNAARTHTYENFKLDGLKFHRWRGLQLLVRIDQPQHLKKATTPVRKEWWEYTNRLRPEALVCILGHDGFIAFGTVSELSHTAGVNKREDTIANDPGKHRNMYSSPAHCHLQLQLVSSDPDSVREVLKLSQEAHAQYLLVEFPGVLLPSFLPTLEALKAMSKRDDLPFGSILARDLDDVRTNDDPGAPAYACQVGFRFELKDIMDDGSSFKFSVNQDFDAETFKAKTQLDDTQADALINSLTHSLALIQGPPGTGKSYTGIALIKVLLAARREARLGPILCVCYTNHALDQLLEHLVRHGVSQIIRLGSRSKSGILEKCSLRAVSQDMVITNTEKRERWETLTALEAEEQNIKDILGHLSNSGSESVLQDYLRTHRYHHFCQLYDNDQNVDEDNFQTVRRDHRSEFQRWLKGGFADNVASRHDRSIDALKFAPLWLMSNRERKALRAHWLDDINFTLSERLVAATEAHREKKAQLDRIRHDQELRCLESANIIGVTTSGLARQLDLLRKLRSKVLVCEEAGEVLEAHILTALIPSVEHLILIGDHLQLPPQIQNFDLSRANPRGRQYSLDVSLFERLIAPEDSQQAQPFSILETQRRMHPTISALIKSTLYPQLKNSEYVEEYPGVTGMRRRLFWFDHRQPESGSEPNQLVTTSHSNDFEIGMTVALVTHLVRQGVYAANDIAILTPYLGQLHKVRKILRNQFEITLNERDVEEMERQGIVDDMEDQTIAKTSVAKTAVLEALAVSTIDNFQGEEAKVVVISLVRSNAQNKCGFLKTPNRINVLLSRAKHGMYIIGNSETSGHVDMWAKVIDILGRDGNFGSHLELECPRHPDFPILVSKPDDFVVFSPEGGCDKKCDKRLDCGHRCQSKCHSETLHNAVKCLEPCTRQLKGCDHGCPKLCGDNCIKACHVKLTGLEVLLACGHIKNALPCWQKQNPALVSCRTIVQKYIPGCNHKLDLVCCVDPTLDSFKCKAVCGAPLECGHACQRSCHECNIRGKGVIVSQNHGTCKQICGKNFNSCSHYCKSACHKGPCECTQPCENFCEHSRCHKLCKEPCAPCASVTCTTGVCPHAAQICTMPCAAPCDWLPCTNRCEKILVCGHQCPTVCGEICPPPQYCQICANQDVKDIMVDLIMMSTYGEANLDEDPCVIPACGHILTVSSMDGQMEMSSHYELNETTISGIKHDSKPFSMKDLKVCGTCRGSLRNIARYGRIVRRALLDQSTKKFSQRAGLQTISLTDDLRSEQQKLGSTLKEKQEKQQTKTKHIKLQGLPEQQFNIVCNGDKPRYRGLRTVRNKIVEHLEKVQVEEQPYKRVWDIVQHAKRHRHNVGDMTLDIDVLQTRETVQMTALMIRCELVLLSDFLALLSNNNLEVNFEQNKAYCEALTDMALAAKQPLHAVEGHMFFAQYCAAERPHTDTNSIDELMTTAKAHIAQAREICRQFPGSTRRIRNELDDVEKMLQSSTFFAPMRDEEWAAVMAAMSREFRGSGHWYTCANGHPFTIGECGAAMEIGRCPQCDAPIGGQNHRAAAGVQHAEDLEGRYANMRI